MIATGDQKANIVTALRDMSSLSQRGPTRAFNPSIVYHRHYAESFQIILTDTNRFVPSLNFDSI